MALAPCRECGAAVSTEAPSCPHCGAPGPAPQAEASGFRLLDSEAAARVVGDRGWTPREITGLTYEAGLGAVDAIVQAQGVAASIGPPLASIGARERGLVIEVAAGGATHSVALPYDCLHSFTVEGGAEVKERGLLGRALLGRALLGGVLFGPIGVIGGGLSTLLPGQRDRASRSLVSVRATDEEGVRGVIVFSCAKTHLPAARQFTEDFARFL